LEVLPAGSEFKFRFQLVIREANRHQCQDLVALFGSALQGMQNEELRFGARTRKGMGQGSVESWNLYYLNMTEEEHVHAWLDRKWHCGVPMQLSELSPDQTDKRHLFRIKADLHLKTSILIRHQGSSHLSPDMVHLTENGAPIVPGTAIGGAFRKRVERIANLVRPETAKSDVIRLFGPLHDPKEGKGKALTAGRVTFSQAPLVHGQHLVQGRVMIDRAFQMPIHGALFDEAPFYPTDNESTNYRFQVEVDLTRCVGEEQFAVDRGLVAMAFKDLALGDLAVGGEVAVGRGVFEMRKMELLEKPADRDYGQWEKDPGWETWNKRLQIREAADV